MKSKLINIHCASLIKHSVFCHGDKTKRSLSRKTAAVKQNARKARFFPRDWGIYRCANTTKTTRQHNYTNLYPFSSLDNGLLEISFYNVHYFKRFNWYVCQLPEIASKHHGHLIAGTKKLCHKLGMTQPNYITLTQWRTLEEFKAYRDEGELFIRLGCE